ncbi:MAG: VOC family protein [Candidatus Marinimicrobia bacterium]|nr:VOC family protein [Candidatus Neomarinimicrobiota bacterium]MCH9023516.1 VOC family protein [Planctomycetota bacterium]
MADGIVHIDIPVKNLDTAPEFYAKVFGWELTPMPNEDYVLFTADGGGISGGFTKPEVHQIGGCVGYIQVDNLETAMESVVENGGQSQLGRQEVGDAGWFALFTDPEGNPMGLWEVKSA